MKPPPTFFRFPSLYIYVRRCTRAHFIMWMNLTNENIDDDDDDGICPL